MSLGLLKHLSPKLYVIFWDIPGNISSKDNKEYDECNSDTENDKDEHKPGTKSISTINLKIAYFNFLVGNTGHPVQPCPKDLF